MTKLSTPFTLIFLLATGTNGALEHIMKQGDRLRLNFNKKFQGGLCRVVMKARGSLVVLKGKPEKNLMWQTGLAPGYVSGDEYVLQLREKGNMAIKRIVSPDGPREKVTVYDTHTDGDVGDYFLGINDDCVLEIREGTVDEPGDLVWTNIKTKMESGDALGTSEIFSYFDYDEECNHFMFMNPNGNLEIYEGIDFADAGDKPPVWESNTERKRGDYQFRINENAVMSLNDVATSEQYWKKDLQNSERPPTSIRDFRLVSFMCKINLNGVGPYARFSNEGTVFMREGDRLPAGSVYSSDDCTLYVQYDGRVEIATRWSGTGEKIDWTSGKARDDTISDEYFLMLHDTGNLAMYRGTIDNYAGRLWSTHTKREVGDYFLSTTKFCDLEVYEGTPEERGGLVWSNRVYELEPGDRLIKGQYFTPPPATSCGAFMALRPDNGELGIYDTTCAIGTVYQYSWCFERNVDWTFDVGLGEYDDFYVEVGKDGKLRFYGISGDGNVLKGEFDMGASDEDFEVAVCGHDDNGVFYKPIAV